MLMSVSVFPVWLGFNVAASIKMRKSPGMRAATDKDAMGFNVAASIKKRKYGRKTARLLSPISFNVAASIKMRKSGA